MPLNPSDDYLAIEAELKREESESVYRFIVFSFWLFVLIVVIWVFSSVREALSSAKIYSFQPRALSQDVKLTPNGTVMTLDGYNVHVFSIKERVRVGSPFSYFSIGHPTDNMWFRVYDAGSEFPPEDKLSGTYRVYTMDGQKPVATTLVEFVDTRR